MKIKSLLAKAEKCATQADTEDLLETLKRVFGGARPLSHLLICNDESCMEGDQVFAWFELNRVISEYYTTMIRPEIRHGQLAVVVRTQYMADGRGLSSQNWQTVEGLDDSVIEAGPDDTVAAVARKAAARAQLDHRELIARLGVQPALAAQVAKKSW